MQILRRLWKAGSALKIAPGGRDYGHRRNGCCRGSVVSWQSRRDGERCVSHIIIIVKVFLFFISLFLMNYYHHHQAKWQAWKIEILSDRQERLSCFLHIQNVHLSPGWFLEFQHDCLSLCNCKLINLTTIISEHYILGTRDICIMRKIWVYDTYTVIKMYKIILNNLELFNTSVKMGPGTIKRRKIST